MTVDKFGRKEPAQETSSAVAQSAQLNDILLRRDGTNTVILAMERTFSIPLGSKINMTGNTLTNLNNLVNDHDAVNKVYVGENAGTSKNGDTMLGDLNMNGYKITGLSSNLPETGSTG